MVVSPPYRVQVIVPNSLAKSGLGIAMRTHDKYDRYCSFFVMCPECQNNYSTLRYRNFRDPDVMCDSCRKIFTSFPGIPKSSLAYRGPWFQVKQYVGLEGIDKDELAGWIERWTGLTGVGVQV